MTLSALIARARGSAAVPLVVAAVLVLAAAATAQTTSQPRLEPLEGEYVATTRTNVRQQPSSQAQRVGRLEAGAKVRVTGKVAGASWYAVVQDDGKTGFVAAEQLRAASPPAANEAGVREQLARIEAALSDINRRMPDVKELESLSASVKGLLEREEKRAVGLQAADAAAAAAEGPTIADRIAKLQEQIAQQIADQRAEFDRLGERLESVESSVQPLIEWAKRWTSVAVPAANDAQDWLSSTYASVRDWVTSWIPWWDQQPAPPRNAPQGPVKAG